MADNIFKRSFFQPIYKDQTNPSNVGLLAEAADVIVIQLRGVNAAGEHPTQNLTILSIDETGRHITFEYDATNQYVRPEDIYAVTPNYQYVCPEEGNYAITEDDVLTATVTAFEINGVETTGSWPVTAEGAADLEAAMQAQLINNGAVTVQYIDAATDYLTVHVMGTTATITVDGNALEAL